MLDREKLVTRGAERVRQAASWCGLGRLSTEVCREIAAHVIDGCTDALSREMPSVSFDIIDGPKIGPRMVRAEDMLARDAKETPG